MGLNEIQPRKPFFLQPKLVFINKSIITIHCPILAFVNSLSWAEWPWHYIQFMHVYVCYIYIYTHYIYIHTWYTLYIIYIIYSYIPWYLPEFRSNQSPWYHPKKKWCLWYDWCLWWSQLNDANLCVFFWSLRSGTAQQRSASSQRSLAWEEWYLAGTYREGIPHGCLGTLPKPTQS